MEGGWLTPRPGRFTPGKEPEPVEYEAATLICEFNNNNLLFLIYVDSSLIRCPSLLDITDMRVLPRNI
jgi:hypothetical protein